MITFFSISRPGPKTGAGLCRCVMHTAAVLAVSAGMATSVMTPVSAKASGTYFTYEVKAPGTKTVTKSSRQSLDATGIKASKNKVKISLKKFYVKGKSVPLSSARLSCRFVSNGHTVSLTEGGKTISISAKLFKAGAGTGNAVLAAGYRNVLSEVVPEATAKIKEKKYKKSISSVENFTNVKIGRYGNNSVNFSVDQSSFLINNRKQKKYSWWISEYRPKNGTWTASDFIVGQKRTFSAGDSAYRFSVQRKGKALTGMKLTDVLIRTGDSLETWAVQESGGYTLPEGWKCGMTFPYAYVLSPVRTLKASSVKKRAISINWSPDKNAQGYSVECSRNSDFSLARTQKYTGWNISKCTASGLRSGKPYYVRIRSWRKVDGKTYYSPWKVLSGTISVR